MNVLLVYGLRDRYETNWFTETRNEVIRQLICDRNRNTHKVMIEFQTGDINEN